MASPRVSRRALLRAAVGAAGTAALSRVSIAASSFQSITIESQDWWEPIPILGGLGHLHMAVTIPTEPVSGVIDVPVRVLAHDNLAHLNLLKFQTDDWSQSVWTMDFDLANEEPFDFVMPIDTRLLSDGWRQFRFYAQGQHSNGNLQVARPILPVYVGNGNARSDASGTGQYRPTAWYKEGSPLLDWGYAISALDRADLPTSGPVPSSWKPRVQFTRNDKGASPPISEWSVHIDPAFHDGDQGQIVASGTGSFKGRVTMPSLLPGSHRLVLVGTQRTAEKRHSAVAAYPFTV